MGCAGAGAAGAAAGGAVGGAAGGADAGSKSEGEDEPPPPPAKRGLGRTPNHLTLRYNICMGHHHTYTDWH